MAAFKVLIRNALNRMGYSLGRYPFHTPLYLQHTARRMEHLASLQIDVRGKTVLDVGAGVGDQSHYYLDRGCSVTLTDAREKNLSYLRDRYPACRVIPLDLDYPSQIEGAPFDIVHCYGVLYHLGSPKEALAFLAEQCSGLLLLESKVSAVHESNVATFDEASDLPSFSVSGQGCLPTRSWILEELRKAFPWVYLPKTQPNHPDFPLDWTEDVSDSKTRRAIFIASRSPLENDILTTKLPALQTPHL